MTRTERTMRPSVLIGRTTCSDRKETTVQSKGSCLQALTAQMCQNINITRKYKQEFCPPTRKNKSIYLISLIRTKALVSYTHRGIQVPFCYIAQPKWKEYNEIKFFGL